MKKNIFIISIFSLTLFGYSSHRVDGTWILSYTDSETAVPYFNQIFTFKNGGFESESFSGLNTYEKTNGLFKLKNNQLTFNDTIYLPIVLIDNNSLVLKDDKFSYTFKKLNDSLKNTDSNKIMFNNKKFEVDVDGHRFSNIGSHPSESF